MPPLKKNLPTTADDGEISERRTQGTRSDHSALGHPVVAGEVVRVLAVGEDVHEQLACTTATTTAVSGSS